MKLQYLALLGIGIIAALCATVLLAWSQAEKPVETVQDASVIVATANISASTRITAEMCEIKQVPKSQAPEGAYSTLEAVIGQVVIADLVAGQPFTQPYFAPQGPGFYVASSLESGKRAVSVALADYSGLVGLLYPGSMVDVIASFDMRSKGVDETGVISKTLLRGVKVLAVENKTVVSSQSADDSKSAPKTNENRNRVTLLVSPDEAELLQLAQVHGVISLSLRNPKDQTPVEEGMTRLSDLGLPDALLAMGPGPSHEPTRAVEPTPLPEVKPEPLTAEPPPPSPRVVRREPEAAQLWNTVVLKGGSSQTVSFPMPRDKRN
jgi:pilus assembly protein CpaB